jgi:hypothetical protein
MKHMYKKNITKKIPCIVDTLLKLNTEQIELLSDSLLNKLTNSDLRKITTHPNVNYELILKIKYADQKNYIYNL